MNKQELEKILEQHKKWIHNPTEGKKADLHDADLRYANLRYANLSGANLCDAYLHDADLRYANLRYANLSGANLSYSNLRGANLSYALINDFRFYAYGLPYKTVQHLMALDFKDLGKNAKEIVEEAIKKGECPFKGIQPRFYYLCGHYWENGLKGYFTTDLSFDEIWKMLVKDIRKEGKP